MNSTFFLISLLASTSLLAETTIRIPVRDESGISAVQINLELKAKGLKTLPEYFEISSKEKDAYKKYESFSAMFDKTVAPLQKDYYWSSETIPNADAPGTCYTGEGGQEVVDAVFNLAGSFYTEQMNLWGWKFKSVVFVNNENESEEGETLKALNKDSKAWREWRGKSEAVLMVIAYSDDGDDMNESIIPKCR
jgi:hypothetical protein